MHIPESYTVRGGGPSTALQGARSRPGLHRVLQVIRNPGDPKVENSLRNNLVGSILHGALKTCSFTLLSILAFFQRILLNLSLQDSDNTTFLYKL